MVRLYQTFSMYIVTGETRSAGCLCNSSGWFKHIEPHRTYSNHNITELARCGEVCHRSSGWFGMIAAGREVGCSRTAPHFCIKTLHTLLTLKACVLRRFEEVRCVHTEA